MKEILTNIGLLLLFVAACLVLAWVLPEKATLGVVIILQLLTFAAMVKRH